MIEGFWSSYAQKKGKLPDSDMIITSVYLNPDAMVGVHEENKHGTKIKACRP